MARVIMPLCAERHYMGSTSNGRFSTDRSLRPDYDRRPSAQTRARWAANHDANLTRYLRDQHVVEVISQQLRLIGISPKQEALIRAEIAARSEARTARLSA